MFTPHQLEYLVKVFGADHIIMGTDYPFDMADYDPVGHVAGRNRSTRKPSRRSAAGMRRSCWDCSRYRHANTGCSRSATRVVSSRQHFAELIDQRGGRRVDGAAVHLQPHDAPLAFRNGVELDRVLARDVGEADAADRCDLLRVEPQRRMMPAPHHHRRDEIARARRIVVERAENIARRQFEPDLFGEFAQRRRDRRLARDRCARPAAPIVRHASAGPRRGR